MGRGAEFRARQLHVRVTAQEVNGGHLVALVAVETGEAAADGFPSNYQTLRAVLAVRLVTGARLQQDHWWGVLAEQPAEEDEQKTSSFKRAISRNLYLVITCSECYIWRLVKEVGTVILLTLTSFTINDTAKKLIMCSFLLHFLCVLETLLFLSIFLT